jgi:hypothetical protein
MSNEDMASRIQVYNECKCDKRMSPVMRLPNEKSVLF